MKIGFTGTREGMTALQKASFKQLLVDKGATELHHGDCVGADADAHAIALELGLRIVIHPPVDRAHRAYCQGAHFTWHEKTHFARNRDIVNETELLVGASIADHPLDKGGTWYTINYARKTRDAYVIWPVGTISLMLRLR